MIIYKFETVKSFYKLQNIRQMYKLHLVVALLGNVGGLLPILKLLPHFTI